MAVDFAAMSDPDYKDDKDVVVNTIQNAIVTDTEAISVGITDHLSASTWTRLVGQGTHRRIYLCGDPKRQAFHLAARSRFDFDPVRQRPSSLRNSS